MIYRLKKSIVTKEVGEYVLNDSILATHRPKSGDVGLFEIIEIDRHGSIQGRDKRSITLFEGDVIMATFADRYATSQFEGYVPKEPQEFYDILGAGGAIGVVTTKNASLEDVEPTKVKLIGYCCTNDGEVINTKYYGTEKRSFNGSVPNNAKVILCTGSTMDSGKTTTAAHLCRGLKLTGEKVAYIKFTGTAYAKDKDYVYDCGADISLDFADLGYPSTYMCDLPELLDLYQSLLGLLEKENPGYIVMEIADGLYQRETAALLRNPEFMKTISYSVLSCGDSLSAIQGIEVLRTLGKETTLVGGKFTMSPLLIKEFENHLDVPVADIEQMMMGECNHLFAK